MRNRLPFLVPGIIYLLLSVAYFYYGAFLLKPSIDQAKVMHQTSIPADPVNQYAEKLLLLVPFYGLLAYFILRQKQRTLVIVGALFSLLMVPLGPIPALIFLLWTRPNWPKNATKAA